MLCWALCGAGSANFGVVVEIKMRVQRLQCPNGKVIAGSYEWYPTAEEQPTMIQAMNRFYSNDWPDQMTIDSSWFQC